MSTYGDFPPPEGGPEDSRWLDAVRQRVRVPGLLLQIVGMIGVVLGTMYGGLAVANPKGVVDWYFDWVEDMQKDQPPEQRQKLPPKDEAIDSLRIQGPIIGLVVVATGVVIFIGGSKMKDLSGYGWAITGSMLSMFPGMCCCCLPLLPGIWALVVLLNADVKLAFLRPGGGDRDVPMDSRLE